MERIARALQGWQEFGTHAIRGLRSGRRVQSYMGRSTPATTVLYNKAGARWRQAEIAKLFS